MRGKMSMHRAGAVLAVCLALPAISCDIPRDLASCTELVARGPRPIAAERAERFQGKVKEITARCRGGSRAVAYRDTPWTDWSNY